ncbi:heterokaryon incompatibility protein-domain-containing protein [Annulohypoxylon bovei var. microspora]|nr:heterokaryon incompatibility protein-domain-containing protein [Annulohypoxylon bovei var. microspora]
MRLLNVNTLIIKEFQGNVPPYAILSHTWGDEEVSFINFIEGKASSLKGYHKILGCCKQAIYDGLEYVWIDTCCIDKRSSVELSEAINSMFNWYRDSIVCYAYLEDVSSEHMEQDIEVSAGRNYPSDFKHSRWLTRGWTLQELIAPSILVFFASDWVSIGSRDEMKDIIAKITNITPSFFRFGRLGDFSVAQRMSWASHRQTTRIEDQAYCLLGLFSVTMPLVYGEGKRAFVRLQEEIIKESDDQSIFAWCPEDLQYRSSPVELTSKCLLAPSPLYFANSGNIVRCENNNRIRLQNGKYGYELPYTITNKGVQISLPIITSQFGYILTFTRLQEPRKDVSPVVKFSPKDTVAILNCRSTDPQSQIVIFLRQDKNDQKYVRTLQWFELASLPQTEIRTKAVEKQIFIRAHNASSNTPLWLEYKEKRLVIIELLNSPLSEFQLIKTEPEVGFQRQGTPALFLHVSYGHKEVVLLFRHPAGGAFLLLVHPWIFSVAPIDHVRIVHNFEMPSDAPLSQWRQYGQCNTEYQKSPDRLLSLRLNARQATHACIIKLKAFAVSPGVERVLKEYRTLPDVSETLILAKSWNWSSYDTP